MRIKTLITTAILVTAVSGCASQPHYVNTENDRGPITMSLDYRDFQMAADAAIEQMLVAPMFNRPEGGRVILAIGRVSNRTMQHIDTDRMVKKIRVALNQSGKAAVSTVIGHGGPESAAASLNDTMRESDNFNQDTVARKGNFIGAEYELTGKFLQKNSRAGKNHQQVDYTFQLALTHLETGIAVYEYEKDIIKRGTNKTVAW